MTRDRRFRTWLPFASVAIAIGCAEIVGLTGDYREEKPGGSSGSAGNGGSSGGSEQGGSGGRAGESGDAGSVATGGTAGEGVGGSSGMGGDDAGSGGTGGAGSGGTGGSVDTPPSCGEGLRTCGPTSADDCCAIRTVPGGWFDRGNDAAYPARVHSFRFDTYEVSVARFRKFVEAFAGGYLPSDGDGENPNNPEDDGWQSSFTDRLPVDAVALRAALACDEYATWTDDPGDNESRPVNCVDWYVAGAFCIWDGGRLPTEAEWNYAAAGGDQQRVYPWSDPPEQVLIEERHASYMVDPVSQYCGGDYMAKCAMTDLIPVGSRPDGNGAFGHADLSGNVYEWVQDRFADYRTPCQDCANLTNGDDRTIRGGSFINYAELVLTAWRYPWDPEESAGGLGIRCARAIAD